MATKFNDWHHYLFNNSVLGTLKRLSEKKTLQTEDFELVPDPDPITIVRPESPCPTCRTSLFDDEPSCWRCGWRRP